MKALRFTAAKSLEGEALEWLVRSRSPEFDDAAGLRAWLATSEAHGRAFDAQLERLERLDALVPALREEMAQPPVAQPRVVQARSAGAAPRYAAAAGLAAACVALALFAVLGREPQRSVVATAAGQSRTLSLESGASIAVGPDARVDLISLPEGAKVIMGRGDARFRAPGAAPLLIVAGDDLVRVSDASAAVHRRNGRLSIVTAGGPVSIGPVSGGRGPRVTLPPGSRLDHVEGTTVFQVHQPGAADILIR